MKEIHYLSEEEVAKKFFCETPHQRISFEDDGGKEIGHAELILFNDPIKFYYFSFIDVSSGNRRLGFGSQLVEAVNKFLSDKNLPGILMNAETETAGLYLRHGWKALPDSLYMFYFHGGKISDEIIQEMVKEVKKYENK